MRERGLAIAGAVALIAVALLVRAWFTGDDDGSGGGGSGGRGSSGRPVVACTPDLQAICDALADDGQIAVDPPTLDLNEEEVPPEIDAWITWDPAPFIVNENAGQGNAVWADAEPLGSAPLGVLITPADRDELGPDCDWICVTEKASNDWPIGVGNPTTAEGLARWRPVARALAESSEGGYRGVPPGRINAIIDSPADGQDRLTLNAFVTARGSAGGYIGVVPRLETSGAARLTVLTPEPETSATVVVVARAGDDSVTLAEDLRGEVLDGALEQVGVTPGGTLVSDDEALGLWHVWEKAQ